jgi:hypothetical protein
MVKPNKNSKTVKTSIPEGYMRLNIFIRPEYAEDINQLSNRHGMRKYSILDIFLKFYWNRFRDSMDLNLELALEKMKSEVTKYDSFHLFDTEDDDGDEPLFEPAIELLNDDGTDRQEAAFNESMSKND